MPDVLLIVIATEAASVFLGAHVGHHQVLAAPQPPLEDQLPLGPAQAPVDVRAAQDLEVVVTHHLVGGLLQGLQVLPLGQGQHLVAIAQVQADIRG